MEVINNWAPVVLMVQNMIIVFFLAKIARNSEEWR